MVTYESDRSTVAVFKDRVPNLTLTFESKIVIFSPLFTNYLSRKIEVIGQKLCSALCQNGLTHRLMNLTSTFYRLIFIQNGSYSHLKQITCKV